MALTRRQREVLAFIERYMFENGVSPSLGEIAFELGLKSPSAVHKHLVNLERMELIDRSPGRARSISLTPGVASQAVVETPILGSVSAGRPLKLEEDLGTVGLPPEMVRSKQTFLLRVAGDSMLEEQLCDGDLLIIERRKKAQDGETIIAVIQPENATTVKQIFHEGGQIRLQPANRSILPMIFPAESIELIGIVTGLLREY